MSEEYYAQTAAFQMMIDDLFIPKYRDYNSKF